MALSFFGKKKGPSFDPAAMQGINQRGLQTQKDLAAQREQSLKPLNEQFEQKRSALSAQIMPETEQQLTRLGKDISGVGAMEKSAGAEEARRFREQQFRDVPALQQSIRNQLGGSGLMKSGAPLSTLVQPTIQAAQASSDLESTLAQRQIENQARRSEGLATGGFSARQSATAKRMGIDEGTIDELTRMGRTDLIDKFNALAGAEEQFSSNEMGIEQARLANEMAKASKGSSGLGSLLGSVAGLGVGALTGNPMGMAIGTQLGGQLGGLAEGGQAGQLDPTLLFALAQRNKKAYSSAGNMARSTGYSPQFGQVGTGSY